MKIIICGGTGFLGYYTALAAIEDGHEVASLALPEEGFDWMPKEIKRFTTDLFTATEEELIPFFEGYDALVYSVGPDDRVTPQAPSYDYFHERLVEHCAKVLRAAEKAGVKKSVVYNSYFAYFDREYPEKKLAVYHPYIRCRVEQAERCIQQAKTMEVCMLELPYIFGSMPNRIPLWRDVYLERFFRAPVIAFPRGGTTMIGVNAVGQAGLGAVLYGKHGGRYPIGDENHPFRFMLEAMREGLGIPKKPIMQFSAKICAMGANSIAKKDAKEGKQAGLDMKHLMLDIMGEQLYIPEEVIAQNCELFHIQRGGVREKILETMHACYPEGFNKK